MGGIVDAWFRSLVSSMLKRAGDHKLGLMRVGCCAPMHTANYQSCCEHCREGVRIFAATIF